ncbi:MAG: 4-hydroxy-tetrahydrodipicolinate synthase [Bacteroidales bacterium]|nr:4-hydroxy-tetrahydrodipicolinate synthase [Bacteroidales bacterium]MBD5274058.1 4-hydroxy-tetrahydrodipicolinate synthase [Bacteroides sp.]MDE6259129.1 4-hydroxy-tetrahydrodipicolinate synthase [Muribaculaceae bacterium]
MNSFNLRGLGVALITPFKSDKSIDFDALDTLIERLIEAKTDYIVVLGTTGETPALFPEEKKEIREFIKKKTAGRIPLIIGIGGNSTMGVVKELEETDLSGFSAVLSVVPFYNKPSQEGIFQHYKAVADASPLPVVLYNVPGRTGVNMTAATTLRIAEACPNVIGIKEASGNFSQIQEIIKNKKKDFVVISGDDSITYPLIALGAEGVISVIGNAYPKEFGEMVRLCLEDKYEEALPKHLQFTELFNLLFVDGNPAGVKCTLNAMGLIENELRLPLVPTRVSTNEEIHKITAKITE